MIPAASFRSRSLLRVLALGLCVAPGLVLAQAAPPPASGPASASAPASAPARGSAPRPGTPTAYPRWVIPGSAAASVYALVPPLGAPLPPTTFVTEDVSIRQAEVELCFKGPAGRPCLVLLHPSQAQRGDQRTKHFAVRVPAGTDAALAAAALQSIKQRERESPWVAVTPAVGDVSPHARRLNPAIVIGLVLLLVALWLLARGARRRGQSSGASGADGKPGAPPASDA